jgi:putative transposase
MRRSRSSEEQIAMALRQAEAGTPVVEICRKLETSETTFIRWKKKVGGLGVSELRELKQLRDENRKRKAWERTSPWTRASSRRRRERNGDADAAAGGDWVGSDCVRARRTARLSSRRGQPVPCPLPLRDPLRSRFARVFESSRPAG